MPVRIDRFTGQAEGLTGSGWHSLRNSEPTDSNDETLPPSELAHLDGRCSIDSLDWINCDLYNGSTWKLSRVTVAIAVHDPKGSEILSRNYDLVMRPYESGSPTENTQFHASLGFSVAPPQAWSWRITAAKGSRAR